MVGRSCGLRARWKRSRGGFWGGRLRFGDWRIIGERLRGERSIARCMVWMCVGRVLNVSGLGIDEYVEGHHRACWSSRPVSPDV